MGRVYGQGANSAHFPHPLKEEKEQGLHSPLILPFLRFCRLEREQEKRREREGERRHKKGCIFNGKSKEKTRREMMGEEGETKQGAQKMGR